MRLKGGKVLLDLTSHSDGISFQIQLSDEEYKAIIEKGVSIKLHFNEINDYVTKPEITFDLIQSHISFDGEFVISYDTIKYIAGNGDEYDIICRLAEDKTFNVSFE